MQDLVTEASLQRSGMVKTYTNQAAESKRIVKSLSLECPSQSVALKVTPSGPIHQTASPQMNVARSLYKYRFRYSGSDIVNWQPSLTQGKTCPFMEPITVLFAALKNIFAIAFAVFK
jgi:hypothetical protein